MALPFLAGAGVSMLVGSFVAGLAQAAGHIVGRVLLSLGFTYVVYSGFDVLIEWARDQALAALTGATGNLLIVLYLLEIPSIINMWFAAWSASLVIMGLQAGAFKRLVGGGPA